MSFNDRFVIVSDVRRVYSERYRTMTVQYNIRFHPNGMMFFNDIESWYLECLNNVVILLTQNTQPEYKIGVRIDIPSIENVRPIFLSFMRCDQITGQMIADRIFLVLQSNDEFKQGEKIIIQATVLETRRAGVRGSFDFYNIPTHLPANSHKL